MKQLLQLLLICMPLYIYSQDFGNEPLIEMLDFAPTAMYDNTTEGISAEEIKDLLTKGESASWLVSTKNDEMIGFTCKYPYSVVTFFQLPHNNKTSLLVAYTENEKMTTVEIWERNEKVVFEKIELLPAIQAKDFFADEYQFKELSKYDTNVFYFVDKNSRQIKAGLNTFMEKDFETREVDYDISLKWNGEGFDTEKTEITPK